MRFKPTTSPAGAKSRAAGGFTLAEVLAALVFMAIVIPVAVEAVRVASQAGQVGARKAVAARIAERVMNEWLATSGMQQASQTGSIDEGIHHFDWNMRTETWSKDAMSVVTVQVKYKVQGRDYDVNVSTLYDPTLAQTATTTTQ